MITHLVHVRAVHDEDPSTDEISGSLWNLAIDENTVRFQAADLEARLGKTCSADEDATPIDRSVFTTQGDPDEVGGQDPLHGRLLIPDGQGPLLHIHAIAMRTIRSAGGIRRENIQSADGDVTAVKLLPEQDLHLTRRCSDDRVRDVQASGHSYQ